LLTVARVALCLPQKSADALAINLVRCGHTRVGNCQSAFELATLLAAGQSDFAIVASEKRYLDAALISAADLAGVRITALFGSDADRRYAASLGLWETADASGGWPDLETVMLGAATFSLPTPTGVPPGHGASAGPGQVIAVWGPAGSPGRTTLAIALAAELASSGHSVVLADADTHTGSLALSLGILDDPPGFASACQLAGVGSLTFAELDRIAHRYESIHGGFRVLTGISHPSQWPELSAARVKDTIAVCREWADFVILDTGASLENNDETSTDLLCPRRNAATIAAIHEADLVLAIGSADPVGLSRFLRAHVELLKTPRTGRLTVAINRIRVSAVGVNAATRVRQTLERFGGIRLPWFIPDDPISLDAAVLSGRTLRDVAPRSSARLAIVGLVAEHVAPPAVPKRHGRSRVS